MEIILSHFDVLQLAVTGYLCGLIWTVQVVHYPSFSFAGPKDFIAFHQFHSRQITRIVMVPMVAELFLAVLFANQHPDWIGWINLGSVAAIWASTFFISVPLHNRLGEGKNETTIGRLVTTNWIRTVLWTARFLALLFLILK